MAEVEMVEEEDKNRDRGGQTCILRQRRRCCEAHGKGEETVRGRGKRD